MSRSARVASIDVLQTLAGALQRFRGDAASSLDDLEMELRHALEWIHHDRKEYWTREVQRGHENVSQARLQLEQARVMRRVASREPSCVDEKHALERAKRRLETARQKVEAVEHWIYAVDRAVDEFRRSRAQFVTWLDTDLARAVAALNRMSQSLDTYVSLEAPASPAPAAVGSAADSAAAQGGEENSAAPTAHDAETRGTGP